MNLIFQVFYHFFLNKLKKYPLVSQLTLSGIGTAKAVLKDAVDQAWSERDQQTIAFSSLRDVIILERASSPHVLIPGMPANIQEQLVAAGIQGEIFAAAWGGQGGEEDEDEDMENDEAKMCEPELLKSLIEGRKWFKQISHCHK